MLAGTTGGEGEYDAEEEELRDLVVEALYVHNDAKERVAAANLHDEAS